MLHPSLIFARQAISKLEAGLFAATASRSFAGEGTSQDESTMKGPLQNPVVKYPKPPFKSHSQPWPGLASKMEPRSDNGEDSYKGSGRLAGRKARITGGDSGMGRAGAIAFVRDGANRGRLKI
jgi:hypothetical protein